MLRPLRVSRPRQSRRRSLQLLLPLPRACFVNHANDGVNMVRVLENRVLKYKGRDPVKPLTEAISRLDTAIARKYKIQPKRVQPLSYQGFLNCYHGRRRTRYEQAVEQLSRRPLQPKDSRVETFIKNEKFDWLSKRAETDPRAIQPRKPKFLAEVGRWFKPLEHIMYQDLAKRLYDSDEPVIAKGLNAEQTGELLWRKWSRFKRPVCVSLDASRFDLHVSQDMLKWTHRMYNRYCRSKTLNKLLSWTLTNRGTASCADSAYQYEVEGRRMSGDMDTALGNCVIMTCITWFILNELNIKHELLDNGDDCLFICELADAPSDETISKMYLDFGFEVRLESRSEVFERIEFCQTQPVWRGDSWVMIRNIKSLSKDVTDVNCVTDNAFTHWLKAVGLCGRVLNSGIPIFQSFHNMLTRIGTDSRIKNAVYYECGLVNLIKGMTREKREIADETRLSFYRAFGIPPHRQIAIESWYDSLQGPMGKIKIHEWQLQLKEEYAFGSAWFERDDELLPALCGPPAICGGSRDSS
ncbi:putative replicase [Maize umbra-like virus 1]|nr:putative replicase [Maize umbra-like virus 1]